MKQRLRILTAILVLQGIALEAQAAGQYYRYATPSGVKVISDSIPPELARHGYEIIRLNGEVIKTVPRQLTEEELKVYQAGEAERKKQRDEEKRLKKWDETLLLRYSRSKDIEEAGERALREVDIRIRLLQNNLKAQKEALEANQMELAKLQRKGKEPKKILLDTAAGLKQEISYTETSLAQRIKDRKTVEQSYAADLERFQLLSERIRLRQELSKQR
ncbi:MAG: hypothetical protein V7744_01435 [Pseudomonadales bacterium]